MTGLAPAKQQPFAQALGADSQSMRSFWCTLGNGKSGLTVAEVSSIERTLLLGAFVKNFVLLGNTLFEGFFLRDLQGAPRPSPAKPAGLG